MGSKYFFKNKFSLIVLVCLFLAVLGLRCYAGFSLAVKSRGYSLIAVHGIQGVCASVVVLHGPRSCGFWALEHRLNSCDAWAWLLHNLWDLPGSRMELDSLPLSLQGSPIESTFI